MQNTDNSQPTTGWDNNTDTGCRAHDLKDILNSIVAQLTDADRRHTETLHQMQGRLSDLGRETQTLRNRVPNQFAPAFERIEAGMAELANRIADFEAAKAGTEPAGFAVSHATEAAHSAAASSATAHNDVMNEPPVALRSASDALGHPGRRHDDTRLAPGIDPFDVIESSLPGNVSDPWDRDAAEALAGIYETPAANFGAAHGDVPSPAVPSFAPAQFADTAPALPGIDHSWLESRFNEIASRLDQSLADIRPDQGFFAMGQRIDEIERQIGLMSDNVATRADVEGLRLIEAHVDEVAGHLERTHDQLLRLDSIEAQLGDISARLADVHQAAMQEPAAAQAAAMPAFDVEAVARAAAEQAATRFASFKPQAAENPELRDMMQQLLSESRQGDENTGALLDTLQQAMIRLLDRVDAIELAQHQVHQPAAPAPQEYVREQVRFGAEAPRGMLHTDDSEPAAALDAAVAAVANAKSMAPAASAKTSPFDQAPEALVTGEEEAAAADAGARGINRMRQDFIADARRAKMRLAAAENGEAVVVPQPASAGGRGPASAPARGAAAKPAAAAAKAKASPSAPSPRLMVLGVAALLSLAGLWYVLNMRNDGAMEGPALTQNEPVLDLPGKKEAAAPAGTQVPTDGPAAPDDKRKPAGDPTLGPRGDLQDTTRGEIVTGAVTPGQTTVPLPGMTVDAQRQPTANDLARAQRRQSLAKMSGDVGDAVIKAATGGASAGLPVVPAALQPDTDAAQTGEVTPAPVEKGMQSSGGLDMPPATVGPLSLRLAAANGDPSAEFEAGARLAEGKGGPQNFKEAAKWYQKSASHGFAQAQYRLGTLYERGLGVKADAARAEDWYKRAADQGNIKAMHNLAVMSAGQTKGSPNYTEAAKWFEQAADRGLSDSQFNLAVLYENGLGVPQDLKLAYKWLSLASRGGDKEAVHRLEILRTKLSATDLSAGEQLLAGWKAKSTDPIANDSHTAGEAWKKNSQNGFNG